MCRITQLCVTLNYIKLLEAHVQISVYIVSLVFAKSLEI